MKQQVKTVEEGLAKLGIQEVNAMQHEVSRAVANGNDLIITSPTGSGKTLAFALPLISKIAIEQNTIQLLIILPTRELTTQTEKVLRELALGYKINAVYGGRSTHKDQEDLALPPHILIATPGRLLDHLERRTIDLSQVKSLVLDEFDKSLEVGFEVEMSNIIAALPNGAQKILTSATELEDIPEFLQINKPQRLYFDGDNSELVGYYSFISPDKDKLGTLVAALQHLSGQQGIVFCNFKDAVDRVSQHLTDAGIDHECYHGNLDQFQRERVMIKFNNKSITTLIATDLAARGIDIKDLDYVMHYHLPAHANEYTHRNGRTARMGAKGSLYHVLWAEENIPEYLKEIPTYPFEIVAASPKPVKPSEWTTMSITAGRKDKISKGDIAGFVMKQGGCTPKDIGIIDVGRDLSYVAVKSKEAMALLKKLNQAKIKGVKIKVGIA